MFERINDVVDYLKGVDWKQFAYRTLIPSACFGFYDIWWARGWQQYTK